MSEPKEITSQGPIVVCPHCKQRHGDWECTIPFSTCKLCGKTFHLEVEIKRVYTSSTEPPHAR